MKKKLITITFFVGLWCSSVTLALPFLLPQKIDYAQPQIYLNPGQKSTIDQSYLEQIRKGIAITNQDLNGIKVIYRWIRKNFRSYAAGGKLVGTNDVNRILETKLLSGCHDAGLILSSLLRLYGYPAVMVDAAGIQWAEEYRKGRTSFSGHVFVEVYVDEKWIVLDSNSGEWILDYDPNHPVIPIIKRVESKGYYVLLKGIDPADYGVNNINDLQKKLKLFARSLDEIAIEYPEYTVSSI